MRARWPVTIALHAAAAVLMTACSTGSGCAPPPMSELSGAAQRIAVTTGEVLDRDELDYVSAVAVQQGQLIVTDDQGSARPVARAEGPRRLPLPGLRTTGRRLQGMGADGQVRWTQEGAGGDAIGGVRGVAVIVGVDRQLRGVEVATGRLLWNTLLDHRLLVTDARVVGDAVVLSGFGDDRDGNAPVAAAVGAVAGELRWRTPLPGASASLVTVAAGVLAVAQQEQLTGLRVADGARLWTTRLPEDQAVRAVDVEGGAFVVVTTQETYGCD